MADARTGWQAVGMHPARRSRPRRSCHSVPVTRERMVEKAGDLPADVVFLDMEDGVPAAERGEPARAAAVAALARPFGAPTLAVRVNAVGTPWCLGDLTAVVNAPGRLDVVLVPKVEDPGQVAFVCHLLDALEAQSGRPPGAIGVELQVESAGALARVERIAAACPPRVEALVFGPGDFAASLGAPQTMVGELPAVPGADPAGMALFAMVVAARAHGLQAVDGPFGGIGDVEGLVRSAARARAMGCDGKWSIHPSQIAVLNEAFTASAQEVARARAILAALGDGGAASMDGEMVDDATRRLAEAVLRRAG
jgi:citrate lyase subunit beta/citryl-CoA lyase